MFDDPISRTSLHQRSLRGASFSSDNCYFALKRCLSRSSRLTSEPGPDRSIVPALLCVSFATTRNLWSITHNPPFTPVCAEGVVIPIVLKITGR